MLVNLKRALSWQDTTLARLVPLLGRCSPMPLAVSFTVTGACNLRCEMCPTRAAHPRHMELEVYLEVLRELRTAFPLRPLVHLIGGEPLLHPNIELLVERAERYRFPVAITTNGFQLSRRAPALLDLRQVTVSVDGTAQIHDEIRGVKNSYTRAIEGIRTVARLRRGRQPLLAVNCTISPRNVAYLSETAQALAEEPLDSLTFQHMSFDTHKRELVDQIDLDRLRTELEALDRLEVPFPINVFPPIRLEHLGAYYQDPSFPFGRGCLVPWVALRVYEDGTLAPCQDFLVGRVGNEAIGKVWKGRAISRIRRRIAEGHLLRACERCCHRRYYPLVRGAPLSRGM
jgi:MoaA/NifB/PqqE/SkfB family radical SAM enzyme